MSFNTFMMKFTKMENLSDQTLLEMRNRVNHMLSVYYEASASSGWVGRHADKEIEKCNEQMSRIMKEIDRRGLA